MLEVLVVEDTKFDGLKFRDENDGKISLAD
jgi:hypothetical protein